MQRGQDSERRNQTPKIDARPPKNGAKCQNMPELQNTEPDTTRPELQKTEPEA